MPQLFSKRLVNDTIRVKEFFTALDLLGLTVTICKKDSGEPVTQRQAGVLPRVSMVVDGIRYDTAKADALCHTEVFDGWVMDGRMNLPGG